MKKILATLLVATMLLSCMSVIGFADAPTFYTEANFPFASLGKLTESWTATPAAQAYQSNFFAVSGQVPPAALQAPIYKAIAAVSTSYTEQVIPETATTQDMVILPLYADGTGILTWDINVTFDPAYLTYVKTVGNGTITQGVIDNTNGKTNVNGFFSADTTGYIAGLLFKINADAKGDAGLTTATTNVVVEGLEIKTLAGADVALGTSTMAVKLSGLAEGESAELPEATADKLDAAVEFTGTVTAESFSQIPAAQIVSGDSVVYDYNTHGDYRIFFGKFVDATYKQPTAQGFVIEGGKETVKAAAKTEFKAGEPFGILVFGMGAQTKLTATPFIEY